MNEPEEGGTRFYGSGRAGMPLEFVPAAIVALVMAHALCPIDGQR